VEQAAEDALIDLAQRYARRLAPAEKIASVIRVVETTFLDEVAAGQHGAGTLTGVQDVRVYTVPQELLGTRHPILDVRVAVGSTKARLFHVSQVDPNAGPALGQADDLVDRQMVARSLR
jgi:hypothetical protein